ncbi:MAG: tryptophan synthase subunit alpha [Clostridiales bacterium]|jgi:tryptophan synthase alpha chain|nr:tryptophan synthase subunit alpha [Clostridiales bacterium]
MTDNQNGAARITEVFRACGKAFIAYLMAGDPDLAQTRASILALARGGADIIELGLPFSDPIAEGETIQAANLRAFASKTELSGIFELARSLKGELSAPLLFMTYLNPVFNFGYDAFFARCAACGVSGIIIPDLPFEEQAEVAVYTKKHGVALITLVAPTSGPRIAKIARGAEGYLYLVSSMGVTGVRGEITTDLPALVAEIRRHTNVPVAIGFGVHSPEQAGALSSLADGVIVGSAIVELIARHAADAPKILEAYARSMKSAMESK